MTTFDNFSIATVDSASVIVWIAFFSFPIVFVFNEVYIVVFDLKKIIIHIMYVNNLLI